MRVEAILRLSDWQEARKDYEAGLISKEEYEKKTKELKELLTEEEKIEFIDYLHSQLEKHLKSLKASVDRLEAKIKKVD